MVNKFPPTEVLNDREDRLGEQTNNESKHNVKVELEGEEPCLDEDEGLIHETFRRMILFT